MVYHIISKSCFEIVILEEMNRVCMIIINLFNMTIPPGNNDGGAKHCIYQPCATRDYDCINVVIKKQLYATPDGIIDRRNHREALFKVESSKNLGDIIPTT